MASEEEPGADLWGGEYSVVAFRPTWNAVAAFCALLALSSYSWVFYLPFDLPRSWQRPMLPALVTLVLAVFGLALALIGRRLGDKGRIGLFLNATICGVLLTFAGILAMWWTLRR